MRLLTFDRAGKSALGVRLGDEVVVLSIAAPDLPKDLVSLISAGPSAVEAAKKAARQAMGAARVPLANVRHRLPIERPDKIVGIGLNYGGHVAEAGVTEAPKFPGMYLRCPGSLVAHRQPLLRPKLSSELDYDGELLVIIGRTGHLVPPEKALEYVFGYSIFNDGSLRDYNRIPLAVDSGKNFDSTGGFGPEIVTVDELPPGGRGLHLMTRLNGRTMQDDNTKNMTWDVAHAVSLMSGIMTLQPGDLIATGTCAGVGAMQKPPLWMKPGDVVEVEIEGIGTLINPIEDEPARKEA